MKRPKAAGKARRASWSTCWASRIVASSALLFRFSLASLATCPLLLLLLLALRLLLFNALELIDTPVLC